MSDFLAFSYSRLNQFDECPKRFYATSVGKTVKEEETLPMKEGKDTHKALELRVKQGKPLPPHLVQHEPLMKKIIAAPGAKQPEMQLAITPDFAPTDWFDPKNAPRVVWCRAIVDLGIKYMDRAILIDYKTGKQSDDFLQMRLTAAVYLQHFPEVNQITLTYAWLKHDKLTRETMFRAEIPDVWAALMPRINAYQEAYINNDYPAKPIAWRCKRCPVKTCPHWQGSK
jgi:hypothetical protein